MFCFCSKKLLLNLLYYTLWLYIEYYIYIWKQIYTPRTESLRFVCPMWLGNAYIDWGGLGCSGRWNGKQDLHLQAEPGDTRAHVRCRAGAVSLSLCLTSGRGCLFLYQLWVWSPPPLLRYVISPVPLGSINNYKITEKTIRGSNRNISSGGN